MKLTEKKIPLYIMFEYSFKLTEKNGLYVKDWFETFRANENKIVNDVSNMLNIYVITKRVRHKNRLPSRPTSVFNNVVGELYDNFKKATAVFKLDGLRLTIHKRSEKKITCRLTILIYRTKGLESLSEEEQRILIVDLHHAFKVGIDMLISKFLDANTAEEDQEKVKEYFSIEKASIKNLVNDDRTTFVRGILNSMENSSLELGKRYKTLLESKAEELIYEGGNNTHIANVCVTLTCQKESQPKKKIEKNNDEPVKLISKEALMEELDKEDKKEENETQNTEQNAINNTNEKDK